MIYKYVCTIFTSFSIITSRTLTYKANQCAETGTTYTRFSVTVYDENNEMQTDSINITIVFNYTSNLTIYFLKKISNMHNIVNEMGNYMKVDP